ncbi:MAG: methyl-accepting chemotaxis protein [Treponema sp.]|jgi:methyl-accepting chemotaxis protein|nr:methyl-accepting chemotaxis protein [Treponema sp.]
MKIGMKLIVVISLVNLVGIGGLTIAATLFSSSAMTEVVDRNARNVTAVTAGSVKAFLEVPMDSIRSFVQSITDIETAVSPGELRGLINFMLNNIAKANPDWVGVWVVYDANALDGMDASYANTPGNDAAGRFVPYWTNDNGNISMTTLTNYQNAEYYLTPMRTGNEVIAEPYYESINGQRILITSLAVPIKRNGRVIGVAGIDMELTEIQEMVCAITPFGTGNAALYSHSGIVVATVNTAKLGQNLQDVSKELYGDRMDALLRSVKDGTEFNEILDSKEHNARMIVVTSPFFIGGNEGAWLAVTIVDYNTVFASLTQMTMFLIIMSAVILVVVSIIIIILSKTITAPLKKMEGVFEFIGNGDFTKSVEAKGNDEIGNIGRSLNTTLDKIKSLLNTIKSGATDLSNMGSELSSNMTQTAAAINEITANIQSIKGRAINQSASVTETNATMESITVNINKLNEQVDRQTSSVSQSSSAIEEMLANIHSVTNTLTKNMENVNQLETASDVGRSGLQEVSSDIQEIARESEGLFEINSVMENIASQTNLLSMNAAIEAAHAGEAGKGFAVVAAEIRKLAESSSQQSKTISTVLKKIKTSIDKITHSTNNVLTRFEAIDGNIKTVADQEENIRNAMEEQSQGSKQILEAIGNLNDITRQVKGGSEVMREGSKEVTGECKNLEHITQEITGGMNEMATGADQINIAVHRVNELTEQNHQKTDLLLREVSKFKIE